MLSEAVLLACDFKQLTLGVLGVDDVGSDFNICGITVTFSAAYFRPYGELRHVAKVPFAIELLLTGALIVIIVFHLIIVSLINIIFGVRLN